jgi:hypothetical protein
MHFAHIRREFAANFAKNRIIRILLKFERSIVPNSPEIPSSAASTPTGLSISPNAAAGGKRPSPATRNGNRTFTMHKESSGFGQPLRLLR